MRSETFLLTRHSLDLVKLQQDRVEVKRCIARDPTGVEAWQTISRWMFPVAAGELAQLCASWGCVAAAALPSTVTLDGFHAFIARCMPAVRVLPARSWRRDFFLHGCRLQRASMLVGGSVLEMLALEHADRDALLAALQALHLLDEPHLSCLMALRRTLGWLPDVLAAP